LKDSNNKRKLKVLNLKTNDEKIYESVTSFCKILNIVDTSIVHTAIRKRKGIYKNLKIEKI